MEKPVVTHPPVHSKVVLAGQAPGVKEPALGYPFAWTAGKTLFKWLQEHCEITEEQFRRKVYIASVCRCFPGKHPGGGGGDRVPDKEEIKNCSTWMASEFSLLQPELVIAVGKLSISQFVTFKKLTEVIGGKLRVERFGHAFDIVPLPHPSGASTWPRKEPGKALTRRALRRIKEHPAFQEVLYD